MKAVVVPVGVTRETVRGVLRNLLPVDHVVAVTVPGFEDVKRNIVGMLEGLSKAVGASFHEVVFSPWDASPAVKLYRILKEAGCGSVYLVGTTGSRYLLFPLITVLLRYWRDSGSDVLLVHGVEGGDFRVEPLAGYFAVLMRLTRLQKRVLSIIYGGGEPVSGKLLKERYGFGHGVYQVLADLERKGLIRVRRGRIERTFPGELLYSLLAEAAGELTNA